MLWGSAIPAINLGYQLFQVPKGENASLIFFAGWRFMLAGLLTLLIAKFALKKNIIPQGKRGWGCALKLACVQTLLQYVFFYIGVANTPSSEASIIQGVGPFVSILVACYLFRVEKMTLTKWIGGLLGAAAIVLVNITEKGLSASFSFSGIGCLLLSMFSGATSAVMIKRYGRDNDPVVLNGWQFFIGGSVMIVLGFCLGGRLHPVGFSAYLTLGYLAVLSATAYSIWSVLLTNNPVSKVTVWQFLQPIFGVALALILLGQVPTVPLWQLMASLVLACLSIYIVGKAPEKK